MSPAPRRRHNPRIDDLVPFEGLRPATGVEHAGWLVEAMAGREGVALVVPDGFAGYARVLHPLAGGRRWNAVAPAYLEIGIEPYPYPFPDPLPQVEGDMGMGLVDILVPVLAESTSTPQDCHYGLWDGWGELHAGAASAAYARQSRRSPLAALRGRREVRNLVRDRRRADAPLHAFVAACAVLPWWGGRDLLLFDGPLLGVASIGWRGPLPADFHRRGPQWWWPADRSWFVATDIDFPWSYVAGPTALIDALGGHPGVEAVRVRPSHRW